MNSSITIGLELGDIIQIYSPNNVDYHENTYIIQYIDEMLIDMININNGSSKLLTIEEDGKLSDESIENIYLLINFEVLNLNQYLIFLLLLHNLQIIASLVF